MTTGLVFAYNPKMITLLRPFRCSRGLPVLLAAALLSACSSLTPRETGELASIEAPAPLPETVIVAMSVIDTPYRRGGSSPSSGFDCSGLVYYAYRQLGVEIARSAIEQFRQVRRIAQQELAAGDLVFFRLNSKAVSHVGIYRGDGQFIHAPSTGKRVSYARLDDPYWRKRYVGAGRYEIPS
ncbi:MAG: C40 family peptidase [Gammaproteobacteria bacterium]|nr:C40 family peptidase [Gammaproteobacteria bacterium]